MRHPNEQAPVSTSHLGHKRIGGSRKQIIEQRPILSLEQYIATAPPSQNGRICDTMCRMKWPENTCEKFILLSYYSMPLATNSCLFQVGKLARPHKQFSTGIVAASSRQIARAKAREKNYRTSFFPPPPPPPPRRLSKGQQQQRKSQLNNGIPDCQVLNQA